MTTSGGMQTWRYQAVLITAAVTILVPCWQCPCTPSGAQEAVTTIALGALPGVDGRSLAVAADGTIVAGWAEIGSSSRSSAPWPGT